MIVKCANKREDNYEQELIIGKQYCVLGVIFYRNGNIDYNILKNIGEAYKAVLYPYDNFEIVDNRMPNSWVINDLGPWQRINLESASYSAIQDDGIYQNDNVAFITAVNEILAFHDWPLLVIPEYLLPQPTPEERKKKEMEDELEEYLRIAEKDKK